MIARFWQWAALNALAYGLGMKMLASGFAQWVMSSGGAVFTDKNIEWGIWEGCGMDVVIRLIDPEEELADFLFDCEAFFEEDE